MRIPPPGSDPKTISQYCSDLVWQSASDRRRRKCELDWDRALQLMFSEHYAENLPSDDIGRIRLVINRIVRSVLGQMVLQAGDTPEIKFVARETGEPPSYWLRAPVVPGQPPQPSQQIDEATALAIKQKQAIQQAMAAQMVAAGQPAPPQPTNPLIEIDDQERCNALKTVFDTLDEKCNFPFTFRENVYYKLQFGNQPTLFEFDQDQKSFVITNCPPAHVFFQPTTANVLATAYEIFDEYTSADEALAFAASRLAPVQYEKFKDAIEANWTSQQPIVPGNAPYQKSAMYNQIFRQTGGFIRHIWIRNTPYPMTADEAIESGKVVANEVPIAQPTDPAQIQPPAAPAALPSPDSGTPDFSTNSPIDQLAAASGSVNANTVASDTLNDSTNIADGSQPDDLTEYMLPQSTPTTTVFTLAGTTIAVTPPTSADDPNTGLEMVVQTNPQWPVTLAYRQIKIIGQTVVEDCRSPFRYAPIANNINIGIAFSPLGVGEPKILEDLQRAINMLASNIMTWVRDNAVPPEIVLESVANRMEAQIRNMRTRSGTRTIIPNDAVPAGGKMKDAFDYLDTAPIPPDLWKMLDFLMSTIDKEGNQADVAEGNAAPGWSGEAIQSLQNAHNQVVRASGLSTEDWLRHLTRHKIDSIAHLMTPEDCAKICRKYPVEVWQDIHSRFPDLDPILSISIASASGAAKQAQTQSLIAARTAGIGIPDSLIVESMGLDADAVQQGNQQQAEQMAQAQAQQPQPKRPAPGQKQPAEGNGQ